MFALPKLGSLTQGTIFTGAVADQYDGAPVWGLVITARCDTAHDKVPLINYLPIVRVEDWIYRHGGEVALKRAHSECLGRLRNCLTQRGLSHSLLDVYKPSHVVASHFAIPTDVSGKEKARLEREAAQAGELAARIDGISTVLSAGPSKASISADVLAASKKFATDVVRELLGHQLSGYYFIPDIGSLTEMKSLNGYVVLLREVRHISAVTARLLVDGIQRPEIPSGGLTGLTFDKFDFAYPVAEIESPWVEHLMQAFCGLFGRIGVLDFDRSRCDAIVTVSLNSKFGE